MSKPQAPRRWTLSGEETIPTQDLIRVVEEDPILDLLERCHREMSRIVGLPGSEATALSDDLYEALHACGRHVGAARATANGEATS